MKKFAIILVLTLMAAVSANGMDIQETFDPIGAPIHKFQASTGKELSYIDEGDPEWKPVLFVGGAGTNVRVFGLTEFARTLRTQLKLRVISVERDGFGETAYTEGWQFQDYAQEVEEVLDHLGVERFRGIAISGGGPYLATIAAAMPERVVSLHFAAAASFVNSTPECEFDWDYMAGVLRGYITNPMVWWYLGPDTSIQAIPGFQDLAHDDGARSFFIRGQFNDDVNGVLPLETPVVAEYRRFYCSAPVDVTAVKAPVYLYYGTADTSVGLEHADYWEQNFPNIAQVRIYEGEGHDVQYRHWDQILVDMAGKGHRTVVCYRGRSKLLSARVADWLVNHRGGTLGICAWNQ